MSAEIPITIRTRKTTDTKKGMTYPDSRERQMPYYIIKITQTLDKYWAGTDGVTDSKNRSRLLDEEGDGSEATSFCLCGAESL